jgi:tRNA-dihydrouridine synthase A
MKNSFPIFSVAPMMDWTDRHFRYFFRLISKEALLYTEMVTATAVVRGDREKLLGFDPSEHPLVLQLGGDDPKLLAEASKIGEDYGYDAINLNVGCPSDKVQGGNFGACLMRVPSKVAECIELMQKSVNIPVSIKSRIGVDGKESYEDLYHFVKTNHEAGCNWFIVHARIAILKGLSPKENREIPPLKYEFVYKLKKDFPDLKIEVNGGIKNIESCKEHLHHTDGVMVGRSVYDSPYQFAELDSWLSGKNLPKPKIEEIIHSMMEYGLIWQSKGYKIHNIYKHMMGLLHGEAFGKEYRRNLSKLMYTKNVSPSVLMEAAKPFLQHKLLA